jgi:hypothetical protein
MDHVRLLTVTVIGLVALLAAACSTTDTETTPGTAPEEVTSPPADEAAPTATPSGTLSAADASVAAGNFGAHQR